MMNKYRDKSDFEINKAVVIALGAHEVATDIFIDKNRRYDFDKPKSQFFFDPCNNPADGMPIILDNKIDLTHLVGDMVCAKHKEYWCIRKNPYRAAMEVFLIMKDAENEKS
ncbi:DUF2591 family protein [Morganella morganii subsp. sibonii]